MARPWFLHVGLSPRGASHATFSVHRDQQIIAELCQLLEQKRVAPENDQCLREQTLENVEVERQEITAERRELNSRGEHRKVYHQNLESAQETLVQAQGYLHCENDRSCAELQAKCDLEQQNLEPGARDLRSDRHELGPDVHKVMAGQNELEQEHGWLQEKKLEFERAQRQAQLDLMESQQRLKQERARLREDRLRFEEVRKRIAHANLKYGQSLDTRSKQLDEERGEIDRKRQELDQALRELPEEGGWSFGDVDGNLTA